jgi:predicted small metal-binding protein
VERTITCDCGFEARAADDDGLVTEVKRHAFEAHRMDLSDDEARALVSRSATTDRETGKEE